MLTILTLFVTTFNSFACLIEGPAKVYTYDGVSVKASYIKCNDEQKNKFTDIISASQGKLTTNQYQRASGDKKIKLANTIETYSLENLIRTKIKLPKNIRLDVNTNQISGKFTSLKKNESIKVSCDSCHLEGLSNIKLTKTDGIKHNILWVSAKTLFETKVLVSTTNLPYSFDSIKDNHFKEMTKFIASPTQVYTNKSALAFHKLTKNISKNHVLKYNDIIKKELVRYGKPVKVIISRAGLEMSTKASPLENGFLGDEIKLKNIMTNKIFVGKVTNTNEVKVSL